MRQSLTILLFFFTINLLNIPNISGQPVFKSTPGNWADSVLSTLSIDERIAQLFMVAAYSNKGKDHERELAELVEKYKIGGLIFFQGGPLRQAHLTNRLQEKATVPLLIGIDAEWGLAMRLDSTVKYPRQMTLGALKSDSLVYAMGFEIARQSKRLGMHVNFAPVVDINNNPANPVINNRSFGELAGNVTSKGAAYMLGMQENGVMASAKHFPGHGDTDSDSHYSLPVIKHKVDRLQKVELTPYAPLFDKGLASVMVAHLYIPALDSTPNRASTLSPAIVTGLLREKMGFEGLVFTDALNMQGVAKYYEPGQVDLMALKAGNDILLFAQDVPRAISVIKAALQKGEITEAQINESARRVLLAKEWAGLPENKRVDTVRLIEDLNTPEALFLKQKISEKAITLVQNKGGILPLKNLGNRDIAVLTIGGDGGVFENRLAKYCNFKSFEVGSSPSLAEGKMIRDSILGQNTVIANIQGTNNSPSRNFGLSKAAIDLLESIAADREVILVHMGNPYALKALDHPERFRAILIGYEDDPYLSQAAAEALMGAIPISGKLPVSVGSYFPASTGLEIAEANRLHYTSPLEFGMSPDAFATIDSIAMDGVKKRAYPGAQILIAKKGKVIYDRTYGAHTYDEQNPVRTTDIYDLASITKMAATTLSLMKLDDQDKFDLDKPMSEYFPEITQGNPYRDMVPRRMLAHVAGLKAWIPFYVETLQDGKPRWDVYSQSPSDLYSRQVARKIYINRQVSDSLLYRIINTPLRTDFEYKYSDLGFFFMREIVQRKSGLSLDTFAMSNFYKPLGLQTMGYNPLDRFPLDRVIPTEYDTYFRGQLIHGYVHDPGAAMQGGVGGHAGLFSNAEDLAVIMQLLLNKGTYGGERYLSEEVVEEYTRCQFCKNELDKNRRGAGFDKPVMDDGPGPTCKCVSFNSFGHTGFTGTIAWADPEEEIIYIFLSNRVYPSAENNRLAKMDIRTNIQKEIYELFGSTFSNDTASATP